MFARDVSRNKEQGFLKRESVFLVIEAKVRIPE